MIDLTNFTFESRSHLRYECGNPRNVQQNCPRTFTIKENSDGNYLVAILNGSNYTMAPKQMKLIAGFENKIILNGYGYDPIAVRMGMKDEGNFAYYGLTIYLKDNKAVRCVLHMYDRAVDIEYFSGSNGEERNYQPQPNIYLMPHIQAKRFIQNSSIWKNFKSPTEPETYHLIIKSRVTEKMVGISDDDYTEYELFWELQRREEIQMQKFFVFSGWGDSMSTDTIDGLPRFNDYEIGIHEDYFLLILVRIMNRNRPFLPENLKRTVGLESIRSPWD